MQLAIFPTLVTVELDLINEKEANQILNLIVPETLGPHEALTPGGVSSHGQNINILKEFPDIEKKIELEVAKYLETVGFLRKLKLINSWVNIQGKETRLKRHMHPNSYLSGALYLKLDDVSGKLVFFNPNPFIGYYDVEKDTQFTAHQAIITPQLYSLVLFPSWLWHEGTPNLSEERIVLSFNYEYA